MRYAGVGSLADPFGVPKSTSPRTSTAAADFLRISESEFKRMAPGLPRHAVTERRYIYLRSELLAWLTRR